MKKYKWDVFEIRQNINTLESYLHNYQHEDTKNIIESVINQYCEMTASISGNYNYDFYIDYKMSLTKCMEEYTYDLNDSSLPLIELLLDTFEIIKNIIPQQNIDYIVNYNNDYLVNLTNDYLKDTLPPKYLNRYYRLIKNNPNYLNIRYDKTCTCGATYIDPILNKKYISFFRRNEIFDLSTIGHEVFHMIFNDNFAYTINSNPMYYTREIESAFSEFLFTDWIDNKTIVSSSNIRNNHFTHFQIRILNFMVLKIYFDAINNNKFSKKIFNQEWKKLNYDHTLTISDIKDLWNGENAYDNLVYSFSYVAALDLYYIHQNDPEYAFYLLDKIRSVRYSDNPIKVLRKHQLTFMDDDFSNLRQYVKNI